MAHKIETGDAIFSTVGTEWHGLATHVQGTITRETIRESILWPLREMHEVFGRLDACSINGVEYPAAEVKLEERKIILADWRGRTDIPEDMRELVPLHVPTTQYYAIPNYDTFDRVEEMRESLGAEVVSVGTLRGGKTLIISLALKDDGDISICGTGYRRHLNISTGHDGQVFLPHVSMVRMICANTERMSLESASGIDKIKHTVSAATKLPELGKMFERMLGLTEVFRANNEALAEIKMSEGQMREFTNGYFARDTNVKAGNTLSTRAQNAADAIVNLAHHGRGTNGKTAYDLLCGATEYYSEGDGAGKKTRGQWDRLQNSLFGSAMDHKEGFATGLLSKETRADFGKAGKAVIDVRRKLAEVAN